MFPAACGPLMQEQPLHGACEGARSNNEDYEIEKIAADKRRSLRHEAKSVKLDSKCLDDKDDQSQVKDKRRQMRKDLHKLRRCMARTGVAAVAVSMFTGQTDGVSSMDQASRFRRQHRPPIPELFPELYNEDPDYDALASTNARYIRPYRDCVLDEGGEVDLSASSVTSSLTAEDWDKLSDMGSEAGSQMDCESTLDGISAEGSGILFDWDGRSDFDCQQDAIAEGCLRGITNYQIDGQLESIDCLDSGSRLRRPNLFQPRRPARRHMRKATAAIGRFGAIDAPGLHDLADVSSADRRNEVQVSAQDSPSAPEHLETLGFTTASFGLCAMARGLPAWFAVQFGAGISTLATLLGDAPLHVAGNFASPREVRLAMRRAMTGDEEERHTAKILLCCTLSSLVLLTLSWICLALVVLAFVAIPESLDDQEQTPDDAGMIDAHGRPKSISSVLAVVMISVFAGNGLAISHPMRDALLCGV